MFSKRVKSAALGLTTFVLVGFGTAVANTAVANVVQADPANACKVLMYELGRNAQGTDTSANRNAEFVRLVNKSGAALDVTGWSLHDSYKDPEGVYGNRYVFKASDLPSGSPFKVDDKVVLPAGGQVYVYNGAGVDGTPTNTTAAIYRNFKHHYNNAGETVQLDDKDGTVVAFRTYTSYRDKTGPVC